LPETCREVEINILRSTVHLIEFMLTVNKLVKLPVFGFSLQRSRINPTVVRC